MGQKNLYFLKIFQKNTLENLCYNSNLLHCIIDSVKQILKRKNKKDLNESCFKLGANQTGMNFMIFVIIFVENLSTIQCYGWSCSKDQLPKRRFPMAANRSNGWAVVVAGEKTL